MGLRAERWFSQHRLAFDRRGWKYTALTLRAVSPVRLCGLPMLTPQYVPLGKADRVAAWLAATKTAGRPAKFNTHVASAVRICTTAKERGLDISGTVFRVGGEPLTPARRSAIERAGCRVVAHYTMTETGRIGMACAAAQAPDGVHLLLDKLALIRRPTADGAADVLASVLTTLLPTTPKLLLNVEGGDYCLKVEGGAAASSTAWAIPCTYTPSAAMRS